MFCFVLFSFSHCFLKNIASWYILQNKKKDIKFILLFSSRKSNFICMYFYARAF